MIAACHAARGVFALLIAVVFASPIAHAHLGVSPKSLRQLVQEADLVVVAKVGRIDTVWGADGTWQRPVVVASVEQTIKGRVPRGETVRFAQHGHGVADYKAGDEVLLLLRRIHRSRELKQLAASGRIKWYSAQEHQDSYVLLPESRSAVVSAARKYARVQRLPKAKQTAALRRVTRDALASNDTRLLTSALHDLELLVDEPLLTKRDGPFLNRIIHDARVPIGVRVRLARNLQRRALLSDETVWVSLLRRTSGSDRVAVIRAVAAEPGPEVQAQLLAFLETDDLTTASEAAIALGNCRDGAVTQALNKALQSPEKRLALAAIRALGNIATSAALANLKVAAAKHPNADVRRRAEAEVRLLQQR